MIKYIFKFIFEYGLRKTRLSSKILINILNSQGFEVVEFSAYDLTDSESLISCLGLNEYAKAHDCFTYVSKDHEYKYVFIRGHISDRDKIYPLAHEEGHIYQEHFTGKSGLVHDTDTRKELAANIFSYAVLVINRVALKFKAILIHVTLIAVAVVATLFVTEYYSATPAPTEQEQVQEPEPSADTIQVYWGSDNSSIFHLYEECSALKHYDEVKTATLAESGKQYCCKNCKNKKSELAELYELFKE